MLLGLRVLYIVAVTTFLLTESFATPPPGKQSSEITIESLLSLQFINNLNRSDAFVYITSRDKIGGLMLLTNAGTWYRPVIHGARFVKVDPTLVLIFDPNRAYTKEFLIPAEIESGRVWVATGELPFHVATSENGTSSILEPSPLDLSDDTSWGFLELTNTKRGGLYANISFVDFVGLALSIALVLGRNQVQTVKGLPDNAVTRICDALDVQSSLDGFPWDRMCISAGDGKPIRVLSPNLYEAANPGASGDYYNHYSEQVWKKYTSQDLLIDTQSAIGLVKCRVYANEELVCDGDNRGYTRPSAADVWGCNTGPFMIREGDNYIHRLIVPRLCAAFARTTLLIEGEESQPAVSNTSYYLESPTNHYSRLVHRSEIDGKGYAFSYDDVNPLAENVAGVVAGPDPEVLKIFIGGMKATVGEHTVLQ